MREPMNTSLICLGLLSDGDLSGYEIKKLFETRFSHFATAGYGSIYPALADLAARGLVVPREVAQAKRPDKRVYHITEAGFAHLKAAILTIKPRHKVRSEFCLLMYFAHLLPPEAAIARLDSMIAHWREMLDGDLCCLERHRAGLTPGQRFDLGFGQAMIRTAIAYCEANRERLSHDLKSRANPAVRAAE